MHTAAYRELDAVQLRVPDRRYPTRRKGLVVGWYWIFGEGFTEPCYLCVWEDLSEGAYLESEMFKSKLGNHD